MTRLSQITVAKSAINRYFTEARKKVYSTSELADVLREQRSDWRLAKHTNTAEFKSFLTTENIVRPITLKATAYARKIIRYCWGEPSKYEIAQAITRRGYLTHAGAAALHGLTNAAPKALYLNVEQSPKPGGIRSSLSQQAIDRAFLREQRQSNLTYHHENLDVTLLSGKNTDRLAVEARVGPQSEILQVTSLERTMIDIAVRPAYAGGILEVLEAYRAAKNRVSPERLVDVLRQLDYVYPYHQVIGFLMQRAGYARRDLTRLSRIGMKYKFYLVHGAIKPKYDADWQLFIPEHLSL